MADQVKITCDMKIIACGSGHFYGVPAWVDAWSYTCPMCAKGQIKTADENAQKTLDECMKKDRAIAILRRALTKAKKRNGK